MFHKQKINTNNVGETEMAMFGNISRRATVATAKAVQKAQDISEITRLSSLINEEERQVNTAYIEIGKMFVEQFAEDAGNSVFGEKIAAINAANERIVKYRRQILDLKGVASCPSCGAEVPRNSAFCSSCGSALPKLEPLLEPGYSKCDKCGATVKSGMNFCTSCGSPLAYSGNPVGIPAGMSAEKICGACGYKNAGDMRFCVECGTKL